MGAGYGVTRYRFELTLLFQTNTTIITQDINPGAGKLLGWELDVPDLEGSGTVTLTLEHPTESNAVYFTKASIAENAFSFGQGAEADFLPAHPHNVDNPKVGTQGVLLRLVTTVVQIANQTFTGSLYIAIP